MSSLEGETLLNQYRVDFFLASGGMGAVYRVWDLKRNVSLAMKVLHEDLAEDPSIFKRFKREARALEKLAHPNIVPFYGLHQTADFAFLLERYIDGPTLKGVLRQRGEPLDEEEALVYLKAMTSALGYAHAHEVVHCDVKPGNVMVDQGGSVFLTDFGVARHAESTTTTLGFAGTAAYMAPEQCRGEAVSAGTDVYALGVMLYEMLTGERPFRGDEQETSGKGDTAAERVRWAQWHMEPRDPSEVNPRISEAMAGVILKALAKDSGERYGSMRELYEDACRAVGLEPEGVPAWVVVPDELVAAESVGNPAITASTIVQEGGGFADLPLISRAKALPAMLPPWVLRGLAVVAIGFVIIFLFSKTQDPTRWAALVSVKTPTSTPSPTRSPTATPTLTPSPTPTLEPLFDWGAETIERSQNVGFFSSLVIDPQGNYHIGYFQDNADMVMYINNTSGQWVYKFVTGGVERGFHLSMDIDQAGNPHFAHHIMGKRHSPRLHYLYWTGMQWEVHILPNTEVTNTDISMVLGQDESVHITYQDKNDRFIKYTHFKDYSWDVRAVDLANTDCRSFPLVVDEFNDPHLTYCASSGGLNYATLNGQTWETETVDPKRGAGLFSSLALSSNGRPHIAYYDQDDKSLKYAYFDSDWIIQTIDEGGDVGQYTSIAIDSKGYIHISYYDVTNSSLKYAHGRGGEWNIYVIDNFGDVGKWTSIALDINDLPRISYLDVDNEDLKFAQAAPLSP